MAKENFPQFVSSWFNNRPLRFLNMEEIHDACDILPKELDETLKRNPHIFNIIATRTPLINLRIPPTAINPLEEIGVIRIRNSAEVEISYRSARQPANLS